MACLPSLPDQQAAPAHAGAGRSGPLTVSGAAVAKWQVLLRLTVKMMP
jgi:hypothetical protein